MAAFRLQLIAGKHEQFVVDADGKTKEVDGKPVAKVYEKGDFLFAATDFSQRWPEKFRTLQPHEQPACLRVETQKAK